MKIELVCNGSPTHTIFATKADVDAALAADASLPFENQRYPQHSMMNRTKIPLVWTTREVDDAYAAMFL